MCYLYFFCLRCCLINIHIFDYPDSRFSGLFTEVPTSPDNRGSTVSETWLQNRPPGRNLGEHRSVRRSGTTSRGTVALVFCWRMRSYLKTEVVSLIRGENIHMESTKHNTPPMSFTGDDLLVISYLNDMHEKENLKQLFEKFPAKDIANKFSTSSKSTQTKN